MCDGVQILRGKIEMHNHRRSFESLRYLSIVTLSILFATNSPQHARSRLDERGRRLWWRGRDYSGGLVLASHNATGRACIILLESDVYE